MLMSTPHVSEVVRHTTGQTLALLLEAKPELRLPKTHVSLIPIVGIASTDALDMDGERIPQEALSWDYFLRMGRIVDNHGRSSGDVIGYPTTVEPVTLPDGLKGTWIEGYLFDDERTRPIIERMRQSQAVGRPFGFSIEAGNVQRNDKGELIKADVVNVALTPYPVNPSCFAAILRSMLQKLRDSKRLDKSLAFGDPNKGTFDSGAALVPQSLGERWPRKGGGNMDNQAAIQKFVEGLTEEEKALLRKALEDGAPEPEAEKCLKKGAADEPEEGEVVGQYSGEEAEGYGPPEEEEEAEGLTEKGLADVASGVEPVEVDVTEFLNTISQQIQQGFADLKAILEQVVKSIPKETGATVAPEIATELGEIKGMLSKLAGAPMVKGVAFGMPTSAPAKPEKSPEMIKGMLLARARDGMVPEDRRLAAAMLAAKMEAGYKPSAMELAAHNIS
jgi:hypothetical protein